MSHSPERVNRPRIDHRVTIGLAAIWAANGKDAEAQAMISRIGGKKGDGHFHHTAYYIARAPATRRLPPAQTLALFIQRRAGMETYKEERDRRKATLAKL